MRKYLRIIALGICVFFSPKEAKSQGNLLLLPRRVVFEGAKRTQEINLANTGKDTATYEISFVEMKMNDDGTFSTITLPDSGQHFASGNVRFFPHSVTLGPNEAQVVKVQIVRSNEFTSGEYRSHLYFRAVPDMRQAADGRGDTSNIAVRLIPVYGISIPVIIRVGDPVADIAFSDVSVSMDNGVPMLNMTINRSGNRSVYGDLTVKYISQNGKETQVGLVKGLAVYTPNALRRFRMELDNKANVNMHTGSLHIKYVVEGKEPKTIERDIVLN